MIGEAEEEGSGWRLLERGHERGEGRAADVESYENPIVFAGGQRL